MKAISIHLTDEEAAAVAAFCAAHRIDQRHWFHAAGMSWLRDVSDDYELLSPFLAAVAAAEALPWIQTTFDSHSTAHES